MKNQTTHLFVFSVWALLCKCYFVSEFLLEPEFSEIVAVHRIHMICVSEITVALLTLDIFQCFLSIPLNT